MTSVQENRKGRLRALTGCCRGCDGNFKMQGDGQCSKCRCCYNCCGSKLVHNSCAARYERMPLGTRVRSDRAAEAAQLKRHRKDFRCEKEPS